MTANPDLPVTPITPHLLVRSLTGDGTGRVWSSGLTRYEIQEWDSGGTATRTLVRSAPWFEPWTELTPVSQGAPPRPRLLGIQWLGQDRLLVLSALPASDWEAHLGQAESGPGGRIRHPNANYTKIFRSRLEVLDLETAEVLVASDNLEDAILIVDSSHVASYHEDEAGNPTIEISRVEFRGARSPK